MIKIQLYLNNYEEYICIDFPCRINVGDEIDFLPFIDFNNYKNDISKETIEYLQSLSSSMTAVSVAWLKYHQGFYQFVCIEEVNRQ